MVTSKTAKIQHIYNKLNLHLPLTSKEIAFAILYMGFPKDFKNN